MSDVDVDALAAALADRLTLADDRPLLGIQGVASRLGLSPRSARKMLDDEVIPSFMVGGLRKVKPSDVDAYVARLSEQE